MIDIISEQISQGQQQKSLQQKDNSYHPIDQTVGCSTYQIKKKKFFNNKEQNFQSQNNVSSHFQQESLKSSGIDINQYLNNNIQNICKQSINDSFKNGKECEPIVKENSKLINNILQEDNKIEKLFKKYLPPILHQEKISRVSQSHKVAPQSKKISKEKKNNSSSEKEQNIACKIQSHKYKSQNKGRQPKFIQISAHRHIPFSNMAYSLTKFDANFNKIIPVLPLNLQFSKPKKL